MKQLPGIVLFTALTGLFACQQSAQNGGQGDTSGLKIAFVNGDSILTNYSEFRAASESLSQKQETAEGLLQVKMEELDKQISAYQRRAQAGTMSPREMQAEEQRLGGMQQELQIESDQMSQQLMSEMQEINARLQKVIKDKLNEIKEEEGYDFIFNSMEGGPILAADDKHDITARVLEELNAGKTTPPADTSKEDQ